MLKCQKIKNGGLDEYWPLNTLKCSHLASLGLEGLIVEYYENLDMFVKPWSEDVMS